MPSETVEIRPRTTGELLDDAWRLALADYPWLGLLSGLFLAPFFCVALLLLTQPAPEGWAAKPLLPALAALLLPLTGLGSGACQELFRLRAEGKPAAPAVCLGGTLRRGLEHAAVRSVTGALAMTCGALLLALGAQEEPGLTGLLLLGLLGAAAVSLPLWVVLAPLHAVLATGRGRPGAGWGQVGREAFFAPGKAAAVTLGRLPLLLLACVNLGLLVAAGLWVAGNLAGLDVAYLKVQLSAGDPVYVMALVLLAWLLLAPFFEASNFLLHLDTRTRQEGLDLRFRVERVFAVGRKSAAVLLAVGLGLLAGAGRLSAAEAPLDVVRAVRAGVERVRDEARAAEPWPGGKRWLPQLQELGRRLERSGAGGPRGVRWYRESVEGFGERNRDDALRVLNQLRSRLSDLEEALAAVPREPRAGAAGKPRLSPEEVKKLLRRQAAAPEHKRPAPEEKVQEDEGPKQPEVKHADGDGGGGRPRPASGAVAPAPGGGFGTVAWVVLAGVVVAILAVAVALFFSSRRSAPAAAAPQKEAPHGTPEEVGPPLYEQPAAVLWKQAEGLAREGRHLEAVRLLYLAVLSTLHHRHLLLCEPTRTNGEYVRQVRLAPEAPPGLHGPFEELTALFELKWYGERACDAADYAACRRLAEDVRARAGKG